MRQAKPNMVVMSARGRDSFNSTQLHAMESCSNLTIHSVLNPISHEVMCELFSQADIIGFTRRATLDFSAQLIEALPKLRGVAVYATGHDWLDTSALQRRHIKLALLPGYSTQTVAEHSIAMMLSMSRRIHLSERVSCGNLPSSTSLRGFELHGKTLGVIGFGRIGQAVSRLASAFGMRVVANDIKPVSLNHDIDLADINQLLAVSDIVMLTCSLKRGSSFLINAEMLSKMKPGALLINPSRSALVDNHAIIEAIASKKLRGYAVDDKVFDSSQLARIEHGRILQTAHTAWYSDEAISRGTQSWVDNLVCLAKELT